MFSKAITRAIRPATGSALRNARSQTSRAYARPAALDLRQDNPSFVLHAIEKTSFDERPVPQVKDDEVLVQISKTGICGSDIHYLQHGRIGDFVLKEPMCLGQESSGVVAKLGEKAVGKRLKEGTRVAIEPYYPCRSCFHCKSGQYHLCPTHQFAATPPSIYGTLCRYYVVPEDMCHPLPDSVSMEDGAMMEPLSVGVHAVNTLGQFKSNQVVIVFGAGPVGLLSMAVAKGLGARQVIAVDSNQERLDFAKGYAATDVFAPPRKEQGENPNDYSLRAANALREQLNLPSEGPGAINLAIEATGAAACVQMGVHLLGPQGTYVQVGMGADTNVAVPLSAMGVKEIKMIGSFRYGAGDYPLAISMVERGLIDLKPLRTHEYSFKDAKIAFETTANGKDAHGKAAIKCIIDAPL